jgi:hypothetical protein
MKTVKSTFLNCAFALLLLGTVTAGAQTTWNYFISPYGDGNFDSIVTWNVTGSLATAPGAVLVTPAPSLAISVVAPGIYADTYSADGTAQPLPDPDGSYFQYYPGTIYAPIVQYATDTAAGNGNESFGLIAPLLPAKGPGMDLFYAPGTQSVQIRLSFSDFNPGTYESVESVFSTPLTVTLTVEAAPEPSTLALILPGAVLSGILARRRFVISRDLPR